MHFWQSDGEWHFVSLEGYEKLKNENLIPDICYAIKYPINNIQDRQWPEVNASEVLQEESDN